MAFADAGQMVPDDAEQQPFQAQAVAALDQPLRLVDPGVDPLQAKAGFVPVAFA